MSPGPLRDRLQNILWLGGGSGAGKSTMARRLAAAHGLRVYATDDVMADHARRAAPQASPLLAAFQGMDIDERWVNRSPETMLETFHWFQGEAFDLIVEDLLGFAPSERIIVEGFRLLPGRVKPLLASAAQAAWLIPTPAFRRAAFASRGTLMEIAGKTSRPDRALANLLRRDDLFTQRIEREAREDGLSVIRVDLDLTLDDLTTRVARALGLSG